MPPGSYLVASSLTPEHNPESIHGRHSAVRHQSQPPPFGMIDSLDSERKRLTVVTPITAGPVADGPGFTDRCRFRTLT